MTTACAVSCFAQGFYFQPIFKQRISGGAMLSFFGKAPHVAENIQPLLGFTVNYNSEIELIDNTSILAGFTYTNQAVQFNGYYVAPGYTYLFDKTFAYTHRLRYQSIQLPLAVKFNFNLETDHPYTPYFFGGLGFSYILHSTVSIVSDSTESQVYKGEADLGYENHLIHRKVNGFFQGGFGIQKNLRKKESALFLDLIYKMDVSRLHYTGYENSNNIRFRNSSVSVVVGMKF
jgi:hypothetical protein